MTANLAAFNKAVIAWTAGLPAEEVRTVQKKLVFDAEERLTEKTPVKTGHARRNWITTVGEPSTQEPASDSALGGNVEAVISSLPFFASVFITNNVPYIERLEEGWSGQAPNGMLAVTFQELTRSLE